MIASRIAAFTRLLGAPAGWQPSTQGPCGHLAIRDEPTSAGPGMTSAWEPTPDELDRLKRGAPVLLTVLGAVHPPVDVRVGEAPRGWP